MAVVRKRVRCVTHCKGTYKFYTSNGPSIMLRLILSQPCVHHFSTSSSQAMALVCNFLSSFCYQYKHGDHANFLGESNTRFLKMCSFC